MKKLTLTLSCLLLLANTYAQKNSLLWEISGNGLKNSSYLFGTYHLAGKSLIDSLPEIRTRFNNCKAVVGEMVMDPSVMTTVAAAMALKDTTLDKLLTPDEFKLVDADVQAVFKTGLISFNHYKPAAVSTMLAVYQAPKTTSETNPQLDGYFQTEGKRLKDTVIGLETAQQQADLLFNTPLAEQKKQLLDAVRKKDKQKAEGEKLYRLYLQQDLKGLEKMMIDTDDDDTPEQRDRLLKNRNLNWITQLPAIISQQPTFIAVGAGHLVGQYGLINQLRLKGYTVKAVKI